MTIRGKRLPLLLVYSLLLLIPVLSMSQELGENWHFVDETNWKNSTMLKKTAVAPIIDGQIDKVWNATDWHPYQVFWSQNQVVPPDYADLYFEWKGLWDDTTLYLLCHVVDDWVIFNPGLVDWWKQDALEITIRPDGSNSGKRDVDPAHWINLFPDPDREENLIRYMHPADHPDFQAALSRTEN